eukprot:7957190-Alexandrium_andersonii.AAC.1
MPGAPRTPASRPTGPVAAGRSTSRASGSTTTCSLTRSGTRPTGGRRAQTSTPSMPRGARAAATS